jgi:hypothetical protein
MPNGKAEPIEKEKSSKATTDPSVKWRDRTLFQVAGFTVQNGEVAAFGGGFVAGVAAQSRLTLW